MRQQSSMQIAGENDGGRGERDWGLELGPLNTNNIQIVPKIIN